MRNKVWVALALSALATAASAQQFYGTGSVGVSRLDADCSGLTTCDKTGTAFKLLGGWRFTPNWAAELGYFDFGKATGSGTELVNGTLVSVSGEVKTSAWGGGIAFHQDLAPNWAFAARLGVAQVRTKISGFGTIGGLSGAGSDSDTTTQPYVGLSVGYRLSRAMTVDFAWDHSRSKHKDAEFRENVDAFGIGMTVGF